MCSTPIYKHQRCKKTLNPEPLTRYKKLGLWTDISSEVTPLNIAIA